MLKKYITFFSLFAIPFYSLIYIVKPAFTLHQDSIVIWLTDFTIMTPRNLFKWNNKLNKNVLNFITTNQNWTISIYFFMF